MKVDIAAQVAPAAAAGTGAAAFITALADVSTQLLGVPLPVVLAACAGAFVARSYASSAEQGFASAALATLGWALAGCVLAPLASWALEQAFSGKLPTNAMAGLALIVAAGLPMALPIIREKAPGILRHWLDKIGGGTKNGGDNGNR